MNCRPSTLGARGRIRWRRSGRKRRRCWRRRRNWRPRRCWSICGSVRPGRCGAAFADVSAAGQIGGCKTGRTRKCSFRRTGRPGRAMQLDWTNANELAVTIGGPALRAFAVSQRVAAFQLGMGHAAACPSRCCRCAGLAGSAASAGQSAAGVANGQQQRGHAPGGRRWRRSGSSTSSLSRCASITDWCRAPLGSTVPTRTGTWSPATGI